MAFRERHDSLRNQTQNRKEREILEICLNIKGKALLLSFLLASSLVLTPSSLPCMTVVYCMLLITSGMRLLPFSLVSSEVGVMD